MTVKEKDDQEQTNQKEDKTDNHNHSMNLAIIGGVVGAGIGLLTSPGTSKKVMKGLNESEVMRMAGKELKRTAQEIITEHALNSIRQSASGYMSKYDGGLLSLKKKNDVGQEERSNNSSNEADHSKYEEIKADNKNLNERLERIEEMLNDLVDSKTSKSS